MYTLINIILHINMHSLPQVNVVTNFKSLEICEEEFDEIFSRLKGKNKKGFISITKENKKYLEILDADKKLKSYWICNEVIFFKK